MSAQHIFSNMHQIEYELHHVGRSTVLFRPNQRLLWALALLKQTFQLWWSREFIDVTGTYWCNRNLLTLHRQILLFERESRSLLAVNRNRYESFCAKSWLDLRIVRVPVPMSYVILIAQPLLFWSVRYLYWVTSITEWLSAGSLTRRSVRPCSWRLSSPTPAATCWGPSTSPAFRSDPLALTQPFLSPGGYLVALFHHPPGRFLQYVVEVPGHDALDSGLYGLVTIVSMPSFFHCLQHRILGGGPIEPLIQPRVA